MKRLKRGLSHDERHDHQWNTVWNRGVKEPGTYLLSPAGCRGLAIDGCTPAYLRVHVYTRITPAPLAACVAADAIHYTRPCPALSGPVHLLQS